MPFKIKSFLAELRRRHVYHVAVAYVVVGLGVLGAAEVVLDPLGLAAARPYIVVLTLAGFPLGLVLAWAYEVRPGEAERVDTRPANLEPGADPSTKGQAPAAPSAEQQQSIAVLPFADLSPGGDQEYFVQGLSEEIINALTQIADLKVAARTSTFALAKQDSDIGAVADRLGVANVLEGSVRKFGDRIRITAQLIEADSGFHLWSDSFDRELSDIFEIQDEIARAVADHLQVTLVGDGASKLVAEATANREAHEAYLRGRYLWSQRTEAGLRAAVDEFQEAITLDPDYAEAHCGLADAYVLIDTYAARVESLDWATHLARGLEEARKAIALAPHLGMAHASLGWGSWFGGQWDTAEREFERALRLNPGYAYAHAWYAHTLAMIGRAVEGIPHAERAVELDPVSPVMIFVLGRVLLLAGHTEEGVAQLCRATKLAPRHVTAWQDLVKALTAEGRYDEGRDALLHLTRTLDSDTEGAGAGYEAVIRYRETGAAQTFPEFDTNLFVQNWLYASTGQADRCVEQLEEIPVRQGAIGWLSAVHVLYGRELLADHPRYKALLEEAEITW